MRPIVLLMFCALLGSCQTVVQCTGDEDCADLEYCYKLPLDPENAEGTEPGFPYEEFGTCTSDCTSDADCHGSARCTPRGICKDLSIDNERQWTGYETGLEQLLRNRRYAPLITCQQFMVCLMACEGEPATCSDCQLQVDAMSQNLADKLLSCMAENCAGQSFSTCLNGPCIDQNLLCRDDI